MTTSPTRLLVLGGGTAGTMVANKVHKALPDWEVTLVDRDDVHDYQPGYLFMPFGMNSPEQVRRSKRRFIDPATRIVTGEVDRVDADARQVLLADGSVLDYDHLVIASGTTPRPDQTPGMLGDGWHRSVNEFYTFEGSLALRDNLATFEGGRLVVHITELPIKCPVAPLEFTFLADDWLRQHGLRERTELVFVTPLDGAFTKPLRLPRCSGSHAGGAGHHGWRPPSSTESRWTRPGEGAPLVRRPRAGLRPPGLHAAHPLRSRSSWRGRRLGERAGNFVTVDRHTMRHLLEVKGDSAHPAIFALGDATATCRRARPARWRTSQAEVLEESLTRAARGDGQPMTHSCSTATPTASWRAAHGRAMLIDFNYDTEPLHRAPSPARWGRSR